MKFPGHIEIRMSENEDYSNYECPHPHDPDMYDFDLQRFFLIIIFNILISKKFFTPQFFFALF